MTIDIFKPEDFEDLVESGFIANRSNKILEKLFKVGFYIKQDPQFIGTVYDDDENCDMKIMYLAEPLEEEKVECDHIIKGGEMLTLDPVLYYKWIIDEIDCPKCGEKLK